MITLASGGVVGALFLWKPFWVNFFPKMEGCPYLCYGGTSVLPTCGLRKGSRACWTRLLGKGDDVSSLTFFARFFESGFRGRSERISRNPTWTISRRRPASGLVFTTRRPSWFLIPSMREGKVGPNFYFMAPMGSTPVPFLTETSVWIGQVSPPLGPRKSSWPDLSELA